MWERLHRYQTIVPSWASYLRFPCWRAQSRPQKDARAGGRPGWTRHSREEAPRWFWFPSKMAWEHHCHSWSSVHWLCWPGHRPSSSVLSAAAHLNQAKPSLGWVTVIVTTEAAATACCVLGTTARQILFTMWAPLSPPSYRQGNWGTWQIRHLYSITASNAQGGIWALGGWLRPRWMLWPGAPVPPGRNLEWPFTPDTGRFS